MKLENDKKQTKRRSPSKRPRAEEGDPMAQSMEPKRDEESPDFPDEWISIAAYYIWKNEGQPEGQEAHYWERAKAELTNLWREGNLPTEWHSVDEER